MKIWIHKTGFRRWWKYLKPTWLNCITWKKGQVKIYRWLWFGFYFNTK